MQFEKIKYDPKKVETVLRWTEMNDNNALDTHELTSKDEPHPDFTIALQALRDVVRDACELPEGAELTIRGLTLKDTTDEEGDAVQGVTITALRELGWCNAPLVLNTPFAPVHSIPHVDAYDLVDEVVDQAKAFVRGKRNQGDLFEQARETARAGGIDRMSVVHDGKEAVIYDRTTEPAA